MDVTKMTAAEAVAVPGPKAMLRMRAFRRLWLAQALSLLGDGFSLIAFSWITLSLTRSSFALGGVLAVQAIFRALLTLVGGAMADKISPRSLMLASSCVRAVLMTTVAALGLSHLLALWTLYVTAAAFGAVDAFFLPARSTILPSVVAPEYLEPANGLLSSGGRVASIVGPPLGGVVAAFNVGVAFIVAAGCFALCALLVSKVTTIGPAGRSARAQPGGSPEPRATGPRRAESMARRIRAGLAYAWADPRIRAVVVIDAAVTFCYAGPFTVGFASLAKYRFSGGAIALGVLEGALTAGAIAGALVGGATRRRPPIGLLIAGLAGWMAIGMLLLGVAGDVITAAAVTLSMGLGVGFQGVFGTSWAQRNVDRDVLGRVIAIDMLAGYILAPISLIVSGSLARSHPEVLFIGTGALLAIIGIGVLSSPPVREMT